MRKFALLVGIDRYEPRGLTNLRFAGHDAAELGDCLRTTCGFDETIVFTSEDTARGDVPMPGRIWDAIRTIGRKASPEDLFLFFFAGHGVFKGEQTFFLTGEATPDGAAAAISLREIRTRAGDTGIRTCIMISDACRNTPELALASVPPPLGTRDIGLHRIAARGNPVPTRFATTWYSLFACSAGERSYEDEKSRHGVYTKFLLEGLRGKARDAAGNVTVNSLNRFATEQVVAWCLRRGRAVQRPYAVADGTPGDTILAPPPRSDQGGLPVAGIPWRLQIADNGPVVAFAWCPPGSFTMGRLGEPIAEPPHPVDIRKGFWLAETPVTRAQFAALRDTAAPADGDAELPATGVTWGDAMDFCRELTRREAAARRLPEGLEYRLPSEAEWEFACRAGTTADLYTGTPLDPSAADGLDALAWHGGNSGGAIHPVRRKRPNGLGLHDMLGNIWEWCLDDYALFDAAAQTDPVCRTPRGQPRKVVRGGGWHSKASSCTCHSRSRLAPGLSREDLGFRIALAQQ